MVLYEDKFAYSHHGTDPTSGKLCNAFDLVRLHKFGLKDEDAKENTAPNRLPSFTAMTGFCQNDSNTIKTLTIEKLSSAQDDFKDVDFNEEEWITKLQYNSKGIIKSTIDNALIILKNDPNLRGRIVFDDFEHREVIFGDLPWRKSKGRRYMVDNDDSALRHYLEANYDLAGQNKIADAIKVAVMQNSIHPVKNYLESLYWDGKERLDRLFIDYLGAKDIEITRLFTRKSIVAAVKRIYEPGCKFDYVLTLVGKTGVGKSTIIKKLGKDWFSDSLGTVIGKEAYEQLQGVWLIELGELSALKRAEANQIKHFITKREDRFRVAYGHRSENFPRQCVFFGTTNDRNFLNDPTGNRRFWPLDVYDLEPTKDVFKDLTDYEIDQIWAEAKLLYESGEEVYLSKSEEEKAKMLQEDHEVTNEKIGMIENYLDLELPNEWDSMDLIERQQFIHNKDNRDRILENTLGTHKRDRGCVAEIWCELFRGNQKDLNRWSSKEINDIMIKVNGWKEWKGNKKGLLRFKLYGLQKGYFIDYVN